MGKQDCPGASGSCESLRLISVEGRPQNGIMGCMMSLRKVTFTHVTSINITSSPTIHGWIWDQTLTKRLDLQHLAWMRLKSYASCFETLILRMPRRLQVTSSVITYSQLHHHIRNRCPTAPRPRSQPPSPPARLPLALAPAAQRRRGMPSTPPWARPRPSSCPHAHCAAARAPAAAPPEVLGQSALRPTPCFQEP